MQSCIRPGKIFVAKQLQNNLLMMKVFTDEEFTEIMLEQTFTDTKKMADFCILLSQMKKDTKCLTINLSLYINNTRFPFLRNFYSCATETRNIYARKSKCDICTTKVHINTLCLSLRDFIVVLRFYEKENTLSQAKLKGWANLQIRSQATDQF